jgi:hypothetical protein
LLARFQYKTNKAKYFISDQLTFSRVVIVQSSSYSDGYSNLNFLNSDIFNKK